MSIDTVKKLIQDNSSFASEGTGNLATAGAGLAGGLIDAIGGEKPSMAMSGLSGAAKGAAAGAAGGPIGMAAGAAIGLATSLIKSNAEAKKAEKARKEKELADLNAEGAILANQQQAAGIKEQNMMKTGGVVQGKGGIDKISAKLPDNAFVVPTKEANNPVIQKATNLLGYKNADKTKGNNDVMLTKGEVVIAPEHVSVVDNIAKQHGMKGIDDLAPNSKIKAAKMLACGGKVKKMETGGPVKKSFTVKDRDLTNDETKSGFTESQLRGKKTITVEEQKNTKNAFVDYKALAAEKLLQKDKTTSGLKCGGSVKKHKKRMMKDGGLTDSQLAEKYKFKVSDHENESYITNPDGTIEYTGNPVASAKVKAKKITPTEKAKSTPGTKLGIAQGMMGIAGLISSGKSPISKGFPEYKISAAILNDVATLSAKRNQGIDSAVRNNIDQTIETNRQEDVGLAKETSNGSGTTAFNRAILANNNATTKRMQVATMDQEQRDKNLNASIDANKMVAGMERTIYEDKIKKTLLDQNQWDQKQGAWGEVLASGIKNVIGSEQLQAEKDANAKLYKMING